MFLKVEQGEGVFKLRNISYKDVNTAPMLQKEKFTVEKKLWTQPWLREKHNKALSADAE